MLLNRFNGRQKQTYTMSVPKRVPTTTVNGGGDGEGSNGMDESGE